MNEKVWNSNLVNEIRRLAIKNVCVYDQKRNTFHLPELQTTKSDDATIFIKYKEITDSDKETQEANFSYFVREVLKGTKLSANSKKIESSISDFPALQHIVLCEEGNRRTELLCIGNEDFVVLDTNRSGIIPDDRLRSITRPWNIGELIKFDIFRNGAKYCPEGLQNEFQYVFVSKKITSIELLSPSEIHKIIDLKFIPAKFREIPNNRDIKETMEYLDTLNTDQINEKYKECLVYVGRFGVSSYTVNLLIEVKRRVRNTNYTYDVDDWIENISESQKTDIENRIRKQKESEVIKLQNDYTKSLKNKLQQGRFLLIFKRSGYYTKQAEKELKGISDALEQLAKEGYCVKDWAQSQKNDYLKKHEASKRGNLITGLKFMGITAAIILATVVFLQTKNGIISFNSAIKQADLLKDEKKYTEAKDTYTQAYLDFKPRLMSLTVKFKYNSRMDDVEKAIDEDVKLGIETINTLLKADKGIFKNESKELLFKLLDLRPTNKALLELKEKWLKQPN